MRHESDLIMQIKFFTQVRKLLITHIAINSSKFLKIRKNFLNREVNILTNLQISVSI